MNRTTVKSSTIFVAEGNKTRVFRSLGEMPADLRRRLEKSTNGMHSATILIADRRGRDEIARALDGLPTEFQSKAAAQVSGKRKTAQREEAFKATLKGICFSPWLRYGFPVVIGAAIWILYQFM